MEGSVAEFEDAIFDKRGCQMEWDHHWSADRRPPSADRQPPSPCVGPEQCSCSERSERAERSEHVWPQIVRNIWPTLIKI